MTMPRPVWVRHRWDLTGLDVTMPVPAGYSFRLASAVEATEVTQVVLAAYAGDPAWAPQLDAIKERLTERIQTTLGRPNAAYMVAEYQGAIVAVSGVAEAHWTDQQLLTGVCVLPEHQRRGLGTYLLGESLLWLRGRGLAHAQVYTEEGSVADRKIYPRFGSQRTVGVEYPAARSPRGLTSA